MDMRNIDGSYMSPEQIVDGILSHSPDWHESDKLCILNNFGPPEGEPKSINYILGKIQYLRWIRNSYGLWKEGNPYVVLNPDPNANDVVDHPLFPDNLSAAILDKVVERFKKQQQGPDLLAITREVVNQ